MGVMTMGIRNTDLNRFRPRTRSNNNSARIVPKINSRETETDEKITVSFREFKTFGSVKIERFPEMVASEVNDRVKYPRPIRFGRPSVASSFNENGFSDHFPVSIILQETI